MDLKASFLGKELEMKIIDLINSIFKREKEKDKDNELKKIREQQDELVEEYHEKSGLSMKDLTEFGGKL